MSRLVAIGDNVTDLYVDLGSMFPGGNSVNVAVHAARAGSRVAYVGVVGDDPRGRLLRESMEQEGVETARLRVSPGPTASAVVRHVDGDRVFGPNDKGVSLFRPDRDDLAYLATFDLAHSSYCAGMEAVLPELASAVPLSFDFNDRTHDGYPDDLLPYVRVAAFSASHLPLPETEDLLRWAHARGPAYVFGTRGSRGAVLFDGREMRYADAVPVDVVDTLGAGDAFLGRALHGLLAGESPDELLAAGVRPAGEACRTFGGYGHGTDLPAGLLETLYAQQAATPRRGP